MNVYILPPISVLEILSKDIIHHLQGVLTTKSTNFKLNNVDIIIKIGGDFYEKNG